MTKLALILIPLTMVRLAEAYVLPADFIINRMAHKAICGRAALKGSIDDGLGVRQVDLEVDDGRLFALSDATGQKNKTALAINLLQVLISCAPPVEIAHRLKAYLKKAGIDLAQVSLGIFDHEPIFIIGAASGEPRPPQVLIRKDDFFPVMEKRGGQEIRFDRWHPVESLKRAYFPRIVATGTMTISIAEEPWGKIY